MFITACYDSTNRTAVGTKSVQFETHALVIRAYTMLTINTQFTIALIHRFQKECPTEFFVNLRQQTIENNSHHNVALLQK